MNVVIIEDEKPAAKRLTKLLVDLNSEIQIITRIDTVKKSAQWFIDNDSPDLIFMDIQLADGLSFEIFEQVEINSPVIFTTAYDEYALRAFKVNSIDYLLKPIDIDELRNTFEKMEKFGFNAPRSQQDTAHQIAQAMQMLTSQHKNRFIIKVGEHIKSVPTNDIQYYYSRDKATFCTTLEGRNYLLDYSLEQIESMLDPKRVYRINRKYIISIESIKDIISYSNSRLKIILHNNDDNDIIVSRDRVAEFKRWLDR